MPSVLRRLVIWDDDCPEEPKDPRAGLPIREGHDDEYEHDVSKYLVVILHMCWTAVLFLVDNLDQLPRFSISTVPRCRQGNLTQGCTRH